MWVGCPGGYGCCSPEWGKSPVETCGLAACWEGWVPTGDLSGTRTGAVGLTGHSEGRNRAIKKRDHKWITIAAFYKLDPPEDAAHEIESFREPEGQTEPIPPPQITPKLVVCFSVHLNLIKSTFPSLSQQKYHNIWGIMSIHSNETQTLEEPTLDLGHSQCVLVYLGKSFRGISPVQGLVQHAGVGAGCLLGY